MEYIEYRQYPNIRACRPPYRRLHPNGLIGNEFTDRLLTEHINAGGSVAGWKRRIAGLRIVRLPDSTKPESDIPSKAARQACYRPIGEPQSVQDYADKVAALPGDLSIKNRNVAYEDLWWDCQGGHCMGQTGHAGHTRDVGKPYIQFLPPEDDE